MQLKRNEMIKESKGRYIESDVVFVHKWLINRPEHVIELICMPFVSGFILLFNAKKNYLEIQVELRRAFFLCFGDELLLYIHELGVCMFVFYFFLDQRQTRNEPRNMKHQNPLN